MTRLTTTTIQVLLVSLVYTFSYASPMKALQEATTKTDPSSNTFIALMGAKVAPNQPNLLTTPRQPLRIFNTVMEPGYHSQPPLSAHQHLPYQESIAAASMQQQQQQQPLKPKKMRLFGKTFDTTSPPSSLGRIGEAHTNEKAVSPSKPSTPTATPSSPPVLISPSPNSGELATQITRSNSKGKEVIVDTSPDRSNELIQGSEVIAAMNVNNARSKEKSIALANRPWSTGITKKRTPSKRNGRIQKQRKLSTIMEEAQLQNSVHTSAVEISKEKTPEKKKREEELLAQHKFRVIDRDTGKVIPFDRSLHGTHHEYGHPDNTYHYLLNADKLVKKGIMTPFERDQLEHNLKKSVKAIDTMMKKKPGTAIIHGNRNVLFQNPGPEPHDEKTIQRQVKKAMKKYEDLKLRRLIVKKDNFLSFKKPRMDRYYNRLVPASDEANWKAVDPENAGWIQSHNQKVLMKRPGYKKTRADESSSEDEWLTSSSQSASPSASE